MPHTCETVTIKTEAGMTVIMNKSDYDPEKHTLADAAEKDATKAELQAQCDEAGIEYKSNATKAELQALLAE